MLQRSMSGCIQSLVQVRRLQYSSAGVGGTVSAACMCALMTTTTCRRRSCCHACCRECSPPFLQLDRAPWPAGDAQAEGQRARCSPLRAWPLGCIMRSHQWCSVGMLHAVHAVSEWRGVPLLGRSVCAMFCAESGCRGCVSRARGLCELSEGWQRGSLAWWVP